MHVLYKDQLFDTFHGENVRRGEYVPGGNVQGRNVLAGGMAEWLASPDWDRKVVGSNPGVARSDGQRWNLQIFIMFKFNPRYACVRCFGLY